MKVLVAAFTFLSTVVVVAGVNDGRWTNHVEIAEGVYLSVTDDFWNPNKDVLEFGRPYFWLIQNDSTNRHVFYVARGRPFTCRLLDSNGNPVRMTQYGIENDAGRLKRVRNKYNRELYNLAPSPRSIANGVPTMSNGSFFDIGRSFDICAPGTYTFEAQLRYWRRTNNRYEAHSTAPIRLPFVVRFTPPRQKLPGIFDLAPSGVIEVGIGSVAVVIAAFLIVRLNRKM